MKTTCRNCPNVFRVQRPNRNKMIKQLHFEQNNTFIHLPTSF